MLPVTTAQDSIRIGSRFSVNFQRTLRIPDDGAAYPLPPGLGRFPICRVEDYADTVPESWRAHGGVFIPMYQREALWLSFSAQSWHPVAVKVAAGKINALSGKPWRKKLARSKQDYLVCPDQSWLDGFNAGHGFIRQFVAMPLGQGYTAEGQLTGKEDVGGLQICVFEPKPGRFPDEPPRVDEPIPAMACLTCDSAPVEMGLAAGGRMRQEIYPDRYGIETWDESRMGRVFVHIVNSETYRAITGRRAPSTPISARTYTEYGLPWFDLYGGGRGDLDPSGELAGLKSVNEIDVVKDPSGAEQEQVHIPSSQVVGLTAGGLKVGDGDW